MVTGKYLFFQILFQVLCKSSNHSRIQYKYSFLSSWTLFKTNGVNSLFARLPPDLENLENLENLEKVLNFEMDLENLENLKN